MDDAHAMTVFEYSLRMKAHALRKIDRERDIYLLAFTNQVAKSTKSKGKKQEPVYKKFKDLYDHEKYERKLLYPHEEQTNNIINLVFQANNL
jgi:hypothetical protein